MIWPVIFYSTPMLQMCGNVSHRSFLPAWREFRWSYMLKLLWFTLFWKVILCSVMVMHWCFKLTWSSFITYTDGSRMFLWNIRTYLWESTTQISARRSIIFVLSFSLFASLPPGKYRYTTLDKDTVTSFHILPSSSPVILPLDSCHFWYVWPGIGFGHSPLSYSEVEEIIQIYLYPPFGPL